MDVAKNVKQIEAQILRTCEKIGRNREEITVIGVTKYVTIERTEQLLETGHKDIGENRAEEMLHKYAEIGDRANWHFIGTLQSRKVKDVVDKVRAIHSLDRESVARQINNRAREPIDCFVQVNVSGEASKHGLEPDEVETFITSLAQYEKVRIVGLMTMAPHVEDESEIREVFRSLRELRDDIRDKQLPNAPCTELSMGMSNDFQIAIEEGATHIRLGSSLVGS